MKEPMKKTYYKLDIDSYGQPSGTITPVQLTKAEYEMRRGREFIYEDYYQASARAMD